MKHLNDIFKTIYVSFSKPFYFGSPNLKADTPLENINWKKLYLVTSTYFTDIENYEDIKNTNLNSLFKYYQTHYTKVLKNLDKFEIRHLAIVIITKNPLITTMKIVNIKGDNYNSVIKIYLVPFNLFFNLQTIYDFLLKPVLYIEKETKTKSYNLKQNVEINEVDPGFVIFKFENTNYMEICTEFLKLQINLKGGTTAKRHILSIVQSKLFLFVSALEGVDNIFKKINDSYNTNKLLTNVNIDFKVNNNLKDYLKSKEEMEKTLELKPKENDNLNKKNNILNNNPFNTNIQKREFHTNSIYQNNNYNNNNQDNNELNDLLIIQGIISNKLDTKMENELFGLKISDENKIKLGSIIAHKFFKILSGKNYTNLNEGLIDLLKMLDEYSILEEYIDMINVNKNNKDNNKNNEIIETIVSDESTIDYLIKQLQDKIIYDLRNIDIERNEDDYKKIFITIWNEINQNLKDYKIEPKNLRDEFINIMSDINILIKYDTLKNKNKNNLTPVLNLKQRYLIKIKSINSHIHKRNFHTTEILNILKNKTQCINKQIENNKKFTNEQEKQDSIKNNISNINYTNKNNTPFFSIEQKRSFHSSNFIKIDVLNNKIEEEEKWDKEKIKKNLNKIKLSDHFSFYLNSIKINLENKNLNCIEIQNKIENSWVNLIKTFYEDPKFVEKKSKNTFAKNLIEAQKTLEIFIENKVIKNEFPKLYFGLNKIEILMLSYGLAITYINHNVGYNHICGIVGKKIIFYIYMNEKIKNFPFKPNNLELIKDKKLIKDYYTFDEFKKIIDLKNFDHFTLGDFFIGNILMRFPTNIFKREFNQKEGFLNNETAKLTINPIYLDEIKNNPIIEPAALPMICKPNEWSDTSFGGYLINKTLKEGIIIGSIYHGHEMNNKTNLYKAINILNSNKFSVNKLFINYLNNEGKYLLEIINNNIEIYNSDELKKYESEELQKITTLQIANTYQNTLFYLPVQCDWRGRIYTRPFYLDYQGDDLNLSLIEICEGEILTDSGLNSLYIYGANIYNENNISKQTYPNRIKWVKNNMNNILKMEADFILKAENPFVFAAFCLNIIELKKNPNYKVKLPVFMDATCSGIQHLAAIMRDIILASEVNLTIEDESKPPKDIYTNLKEIINYNINEYGKKNELFSSFMFILLQRKHIKTSVMTRVYNVTIIGIKEQLSNIFPNFKINNETYYDLPRKTQGETVRINNLELYKIAEIIYNSIFKTYPSLEIVYKYFIDMTKSMNKVGIPVTWLTPSGLEITQKYFKYKTKKLSKTYGGASKTMVIKDWTDKLDTKSQSLSIIPNIIHSLDSSHLINIVLSSNEKNIRPLLTVHDCFGTLPNNMEKLNLLVKVKFIELYSQSNFLEKFHKLNKKIIQENGLNILYDEQLDQEYILIKRTKNYLPNIPKIGNLDLNDIINSKYMIT